MIPALAYLIAFLVVQGWILLITWGIKDFLSGRRQIDRETPRD